MLRKTGCDTNVKNVRITTNIQIADFSEYRVGGKCFCDLGRT